MKKRFLSVVFCMCMVAGILAVTASATADYTDDELCSMAKQHYKNQHGQEPPVVQVDQKNGNEVVLHLYELTSGHTATWDWYYVNRSAGKGTNFMGEAVDLTPYAPDKSSGGLPFQDVSKNDWFYDSVSYVYQNGLFSGTGATTFSPGSSMDRAMLVTVLYRLEGQPPVSGDAGFCDTASKAYYDNAVTWASSRGIVSGTGGGRPVTFDSIPGGRTFSPHASITHEQLEVILYRYAVLYCGMDGSITADLSGCKDGNQVSSYAKRAVSWCVSKGIVTGNTLTPKSAATRAEVAVMLHRLSSLSQNGGAGYRRPLEKLIKNFGEYGSGSRSMYYDITGDGLEELFCIYQASQGEERAAVYTISGGKPVQLMDENACSLAGAPLANLGVVVKDGRTCVFLQSENGGYTYPETHREGSCKVYRVSNTNLTMAQEVQYELWQSDDTLRADAVIAENGKKRNMTYNEYQSWLNSWTWVATISEHY